MTTQTQPLDTDPQAILHNLPDRECSSFLAQYREFLAAAHRPIGYARLQGLLQMWAIRAKVMSQPGFERDDYAARKEPPKPGDGIPIEQVIAEALGVTAAQAEGYWAAKIALAESGRDL